MKNKHLVKIICISLCAALILCGVGVGAFAAGAGSAIKNADTPKEDTAVTTSLSSDEGDTFKDETVYVMAAADGSPKEIIVSDWIKNPTKADELKDSSELKDIENVKGDESYTMSTDGAMVWGAKGNDIYYQGTTDKKLPVSVKMSFTLDGKSICADDLAGKSGKLVMRIDYTNEQYENVKIDGKDEKIYVPYAVLSGMVLPNENFSNVEVSNGRSLNDGEKTIVAGMAFPGISENLDLDSDKLDIPDHVEITADVKDFELETTLTLVTNEVFNEIDTKDIDSADELKDKLNQLTDAMKQLTEGSSQLYDGLQTLLNKTDELVSGANKLKAGSKSLKDGAAQLDKGAIKLDKGLNELSSNSAKLNGGAKQVFETLLNTASAQLKSAGLDVSTLTIENYDKVLTGAINSLDESVVRAKATAEAKKQVTAGVEQRDAEIRAGVEAAVRKNVLEGVLKEAGLKMTADQYNAAVAAGQIPESVQNSVSQAVEATMNSAGIKATIEKNVSAKKQELIEQNMKSEKVQSQIESAVQTAKDGATSVKTLKGQLDSYNEFYTGLADYTAGVDQAADGADELKTGADSLSAGANTLYAGILQISDGTTQFKDGVRKLSDGALQLSDGIKEFNEQGVQKLVDAVNGDLAGLSARVKAMIDVSKDYQSYAGKDADTSGSVKFIYRTDEIKLDK